MKNKISDLFNSMKWKRRANKFELKYESSLEELNKLKDRVIELQEDKIACLEKYNLTKKELKELKRELIENHKK